MTVLQDQQHRHTPADCDQEVGDGGVEPVPLRFRIGCDRRGQLPDAQRQVGHEAHELPAGRPELPAKCRRIAHAHEPLERLGERPIRSAYHGVARAVEDENPRGRSLVGELADEAALP